MGVRVDGWMITTPHPPLIVQPRNHTSHPHGSNGNGNGNGGGEKKENEKEWKVAVVQTAYANGASTRTFIQLLCMYDG